MRLSTKLLLGLLPAVAVIMVLYAIWAIEQRERSLAEQARAEVRAYSDAVGVAFEHAFRDLQFRDVQEILNDVGRQRQVYGVVVYDTLGEVVMVSEGLTPREGVAPERVRTAARTVATVDLERALGEEQVYSVLRPIQENEGGRVTGVLEVLQPLAFVEEEKARTRQRFFLNTVTLIVALAILTVWLLRRLVDRPLHGLLETIRGFGAGDLSRRVRETASGRELAEVGREFDRMADSLEAARAAVLQEAEERVALERRVREQRRLAAMGTLAAGVAHQISAPLNVIDGRARLLLERDPDREEAHRNLRTILEQTARITRIVRALLGFSSRPEPRIVTVDLPRVVRAAIRRVKPALDEAGLDCPCELPESLPVHGDPDLLEEVLVILLDNAIEAVREAGRGSVEVLVSRTADRARVEVRDTGAGIPEDAAARVFEAFFTTKPGGTGLGLAIARDLIERMGGAIDLRSDTATVATIELSAVEDAGASHTQEMTADESRRVEGGEHV